METKKKRLLLSWVLVLMLFVNIVSPMALADGESSKDVTDLIKDLISGQIKIGSGSYQDIGTIPTNTVITDGQNIDLELTITAFPVYYGAPASSMYVNPGDTAKLILGTSAGLNILDAGPINLLAPGNIKVGEATFAAESGNLVANIIFNWNWSDAEDNSAPNNISKNALNINVGFEASLSADYDGGAGPTGSPKTITILNKSFSLQEPPKEITYTMSKSGTLNNATKSIDWQVKVNATTDSGASHSNLKNYVFKDVLPSGLTYVDSSFKVGGDTKSLDSASTVTSLVYTFPDDTMGEQTITFSTKINDDDYFSNNEKSYTNTATLFKDAAATNHGASATADAVTLSKWVEKKNGIVSSHWGQNRTVEWYITANERGASLTNVKIKDEPRTNQGDGTHTVDSDSAKLQIPNGSDGWKDVAGGDPALTWNAASSQWEITAISTPFRIVFNTNLANDQDGTTGTKTYYNNAEVSWTVDGSEGKNYTSGDGVDVGYNPITKTATDPEKQPNGSYQIKWTVTVDPKSQNFGADIKVYDLLVYGNEQLSGVVSGLPTGVNLSDLTQSTNQKYVSKANEGNGLLTVTQIQQGGVNVADLLSYTVTDTSQLALFEFTSKVGAHIFASNASRTVYNTAMLFRGTTKLNSADASKSITTNVLTKTSPDGFDHINKTAVFKLRVNNDGLDFTNLKDNNGTSSGNITVTDTLPLGWTFDDTFDNGKTYKLTGDTNKVSLDTVVYGETSGGDAGRKTATFTFTKLEAPCDIEIRAKFDLTLYEAQVKENKDQSYQNKSTISYQGWAVSPGGSNMSVTVKGKILDKVRAGGGSGNATELNWTVTYNPFALALSDYTAIKIVDTMDEGLDLPINASGGIDWAEAKIKITPMILGANGALTAGTALDDDTAKTWVDYDSATRTLTFNIPDDRRTEAFKLEYLTYITTSGKTISNSVKLDGWQGSQTEQHVQYQVSNQGGWASVQRGGSIEITKTDGSAPLAGVEFTLFTEGGTALRKGTSGSDGKLRLRAIPVGTYTLKETVAPSTYAIDPRVYIVNVEMNGSTATTTIDGGSNSLTVANSKTDDVGNLTITKTLAGNATDPDKDFMFTVEIAGTANHTYTATFSLKSGTPSQSVTFDGNSKVNLTLKGGESVTIHNLPKDVSYTVTEADYTTDGYTKTVTGADTGTIDAGQTKSVTFTNTKNRPTGGGEAPSTGSLTISKTVAGEGGDRTRKFEFTVSFTGAPGSYPYSGSHSGSLSSGGKISLAHGESITITGLPVGAAYTVTETDYSKDSYVTTHAGDSGTVTSGGSYTAAFTNTRQAVKTGSLSISKTVTGEGADPAGRFEFTVTLTGAPDAYPYTGASSGSLRSGDKLTLAHGESITITGLPEGAAYAVTETAAEGYAVSSTGANGVIAADATQTAAFTNAKGTKPEEPGPGIGGEETPTDGREGEDFHELDDGEVPRGYVRGPDGKLYKVLGYDEDGMPITGDASTGTGAAVFLLLLALGGLAYADVTLRRKKRKTDQ